MPRRPKQDPPGRLSKDIHKHEPEKSAAVGERKKNYPPRTCKVCAAHKKSSEI
jgi:hypothetical protein